MNNISYYDKQVIVQNSLCLETYIIGYKHQGEAIVFFVKADGKVQFAGAVDSYNDRGKNITEEILTENNIKSLDFICWTHPDLDHSKGMKEIIDKYASSNTNIWIPEGVEAGEINCSDEVRKLFSYLKNEMLLGSADYRVYSASDKKDMLFYGPSICFRHLFKEYPIYIVSYSPNSSRLRVQSYGDRYIKNEKSIFCMIQIGQVKVGLTGDIENPTISCLPREVFNQDYHILKIPHHGSESSRLFTEKLAANCNIACSTVYRIGNSKLPIESVLKAYNSRSRNVLCTGKLSSKKENEQYGIITINTDILNLSYSYDLSGNAEEIFFSKDN